MKTKKILPFMIAVCIILSSVPAYASSQGIGDVLGDVLHTDIKVYIDGVRIAGYSIGGWTYVVAEDLLPYGFSVIWDQAARSLSIKRGAASGRPLPVADDSGEVGSPAFPYVYTDIAAYMNDKRAASYAIQGYTVVRAEDIAAEFGGAVYDDAARELRITTDPAIVWNDPVLEMLIRRALNKTAGAIWPSDPDLDRVRAIAIVGDQIRVNSDFTDDASSYWTGGPQTLNGQPVTTGGVKSVEDLKIFRNLTTAQIDSNPVADMDALFNMASLEKLYFNYTDVASIPELKEATNLKTLFASNNNISDIQNIAQYAGLTYLNLSMNAVEDVSALSDLTNLESLQMSNDKVSDITPLSGLSKLNSLNLNYNNITDISALSGLTNLRALWLGANQISGIKALSGLSALTNLYIFGNNITDITPIAGMKNLQELSLGGNPISDLSPATNVPHVIN